MLTVLKLKALLLAAGAAASPVAMVALSDAGRAPDRPAFVEMNAGRISYRLPGDFTRAGKVAAAPHKDVTVAPFAIMQRQVTAAEYQQCVGDGACAPLDADAAASPDRPVVQVSARDADAYAAWLSHKTGEHYRLPTDAEWAFAAGNRYRDSEDIVDPANPARRWLERYESEANAKIAGQETELRPVGGYGANDKGLLDIGGNVWEWTSSCFVRVALDRDSGGTTNCGVRIAQGRHRSYVTDFIRDARAGGCAAGVPPSNLGFRLVREPSLAERVAGVPAHLLERAFKAGAKIGAMTPPRS